MKNLNRIFFVSLLAISSVTYGQKDYKPGYIITNKNDTVYGFINLKSNYQNSRQCEFKRNIDQEPDTYLPFDIKSYRIENSKFYVSKEVTLNDSTEKVFLEYLVDGIVNLYYLKVLDDEYYFIEKDSSMYQLSNSEIEYINKNGEKYVGDSKKYMGTLIYLFRDSPQTSKDVRSTSFDYRSLINITKEYHNSVCKDYQCIDFTRSTKSTIYLEPNVGMISSRMGLKTSEHHAFNTNPVFGVNLRFTPMRAHYLWNVSVGLSYSMNDFNGDFDNTLYFSGTEIFRIHAAYSVVRIPVMIEYSFPGKKLQPFLTLGFNNLLIVNPDCSIIVNSSNFHNIGQEIAPDFRKYQFGIFAGVGIRFKINDKSYIYFKGNYEYSKPVLNTNYVFDYSNTNSLMLSLGYGFSL